MREGNGPVALIVKPSPVLFKNYEYLKRWHLGFGKVRYVGKGIEDVKQASMTSQVLIKSLVREQNSEYVTLVQTRHVHTIGCQLLYSAPLLIDQIAHIPLDGSTAKEVRYSNAVSVVACRLTSTWTLCVFGGTSAMLTAEQSSQ